MPVVIWSDCDCDVRPTLLCRTPMLTLALAHTLVSRLHMAPPLHLDGPYPFALTVQVVLSGMWHTRGSCTVQELCSGVHEHLAVLQQYLDRLAWLVSRGEGSRVSLPTGATGANARGRRASLTLLVLNQMLEKKLEVVDILQQVLGGALHAQGDAASPAQQAHQVYPPAPSPPPVGTMTDKCTLMCA